MIDVNKRKAIYSLHQNGIGRRAIARQLQVSVNTVCTIIQQKGEMPNSLRSDTINLDLELLRSVYNKCDGYLQRVHEILTEEEEIAIAYSTLTKKVRELGLGRSKKERCDQVPDKPGEEMQHDTSEYIVKLDNKRTRVIASIIYLRYSKLRYLKFYRSFNRFKMKCFIHEALSYWEYVAYNCIIDNTNLARLRGTGKNAIIVPEMKEFAMQYGFQFICHEVKHSNRKAGNEKSFDTVTTNFFPGRKFTNLKDLNMQAFDWATVRMLKRPVAKSKLIPAKAFEYEKSYLNKIPTYITPPYLTYERKIDQYGYISFEGNYYWIPGTSRHDVKILRYCSKIEIYYKREKLISYELPCDEVKNKKYSPTGEPKPKYRPQFRKKPTTDEEKNLRALSSEVDEYLKFALTMKGRAKHNFIRQLYALHKKVTKLLFIKAVKRALKYRITEITTIERIIELLFRNEYYEMPSPTHNNEYCNREAYIEGRFTDNVDLSIYDKRMEEDG